MNVDHEVLAFKQRERAKRAAEERIGHLRRMLFEGANRVTAYGLTDEAAAAAALIRAHNCADSLLVLGVLRVAIDNRWDEVVRAGIRHFGEDVIATHLREIHDYGRNTDRSTV